MSTSPALPDLAADDAELERVLAALGVLDQDEVEARAAALAGQRLEIPRGAALDLVLRLTDLTTLEGTDTPERVQEFAETAKRPDPDDPEVPHVAALCVYSDLVDVAVDALDGSQVRVAAVAGAFPSGRAPLAVRMADVAAAVDAGADEVDVVLDRGAFLSGRYADLVSQLRGLRDAAGTARLKVILETAELGSVTDVRDAAWLAMTAGANMVKTSTGKLRDGATLPHVLVLLEAARAFEEAGGQPVGVKASGGVRTAETALGYLTLVAGSVGLEWLTRDRFRFGASSLVDDVVATRRATARR
jgi:deoxyribose-phosphate aldolase